MSVLRMACFSVLAAETIGDGQLRGSGQRAAARCKFTSLSSNGSEFEELTRGSIITALASKGFAFAHEAPVYLQKTDRVVFSSNRLSCSAMGGFGPEACWRLPAASGVDQFAVLSSVDLQTGEVTELNSSVWFDQLVMANGGAPAGDGEHVFLSSQGLGLQNQKAAGIYKLHMATQEVEPVITKTNHAGAPFNSPNDLVVDPVSKALLFTDPIYGYEQGFRPYPKVGNWLWMYSMQENGTNTNYEQPQNLKVLEGLESFARPNGLAFASQQGDVLYVTDTGYFPGVIYAFDVQRDAAKNIVSLSNRRLLLSAQDGIPDGIEVDCEGRIYTGENNGVAVYTKEGARLGVVEVPEGVANFVLVPREDAQGQASTQLVMMGELHIYSTVIKAKTCNSAR